MIKKLYENRIRNESKKINEVRTKKQITKTKKTMKMMKKNRHIALLANTSKPVNHLLSTIQCNTYTQADRWTRMLRRLYIPISVLYSFRSLTVTPQFLFAIPRSKETHLHIHTCMIIYFSMEQAYQELRLEQRTQTIRLNGFFFLRFKLCWRNGNSQFVDNAFARCIGLFILFDYCHLVLQSSGFFVLFCWELRFIVLHWHNSIRKYSTQQIPKIQPRWPVSDASLHLPI